MSNGPNFQEKTGNLVRFLCPEIWSTTRCWGYEKNPFKPLKILAFRAFLEYDGYTVVGSGA